MASSLGIQGLNMISGVLVARSLGPVGKGELTAVLLWPGLLASVGGLGIGDAVVYYAAREPGREREITATGSVMALFQSAVLVGIGYLLTSRFLGHYGQYAVTAGLLNLAWIPLYFLTVNAMSVFQGRLELGRFNLLRLSVVIASVTGLLALIMSNHLSVKNIVLVTLGANSLTVLLAVAMLWSHGWLGGRPQLSLLKSFAVYGLKSHSGNIAGQINARADQAIISIFLAPVALGLYSIAVTITGLIGLLTAPLGQVAFPVVANSRSPEERARSLSDFVRASLIVSAVVACALAVATPFLITLLFGQAFAPATEVAEVLLIAAVVLGANRVLGEALRGFNKPLVPGIGEGIAAVVTLATLAALLPVLGIMGAAIASLLAYATSLAYMVWFCALRLDISPTALLIPRRSDFVWFAHSILNRWKLVRGSISE